MGIVQPNKQAIPGQGKGTEKAMRSRQPHRLTGYFHRADWPFYWIAQVSTTYTQELEMVLKTLGCEVPTWRVLVILQEHRTSSISEVATQAVAKLSTTTKIVYRMKAEGLVQTTPCPKDGRVTLVQLTSNGMQLLGRISDATHGLFEQSFRGLTPLKIKRLNELLKHVLINLIGEHHPLLKTAHPASTGTA